MSSAGPAPEIKTFICVLNRAAEEFDSRQLKSTVIVPGCELNAQGGVASHSMAKGWSFGWVSGMVPAPRGKNFLFFDS